MEPKRIVFSNATPNDQRLIVPNNNIDFSRFNNNPVMLCQHNWYDAPLGFFTDLKLEGANWTAVPVFHRMTERSREYADMYEAGHLRACSIGGDADFECNPAGQPIVDKDGNRTVKKFYLYEISLVTLPSNPDAVVQFGAKFYEKAELQGIHDQIVKLSSPYKQTQMSVKKTPTELAAEKKALLDAATAEYNEAQEALRLSAGGNNSADPSANQLPGVVKEIVTNQTTLMSKMMDMFTTLMGGKKKLEAEELMSPPAQSDKPSTEVTDNTVEQPKPTGLSTKQEQLKALAETALAAANKAMKSAQTLKAAAEASTATDTDRVAFESAMTEFGTKMAAAEAANAAFTTSLEADDEEDMAAKPKKEKVKNAAGATPTTLATGVNKPAAAQAAQGVTLKTVEELKQENVTLAPKPEIRAKVSKMGRVSFSALNDPKNAEGTRILERCLAHNSEDKDISDYAVVLSSIMEDEKYKAVVEKFSLHTVSSSQFEGIRRAGNHEKRAGIGLSSIMNDLASGSIEVMASGGRMMMTSDLSQKNRVKLTSTDNALAAPALNTIEWLALALYTLYPNNDWKNDISMLPAQMTSKNTGLIWANIAADPAIYFGDKPVAPADYIYDDDAVALTLLSSWLQPMVWTPLSLHQLRYDKMATGWAQAFAKWGAAIDDKLIYILASTVPAASVLQTIGQKNPNGYASFAQTGANNPDAFLYNPNLVANLAAPAYADATRLEQIFMRQNYNLATEKLRWVLDPTALKYIKLDPDTKSLLTRWVESNSEDLLKISHTVFHDRSKVAIYDPATGQVKDPAGAIPATSVSAMIAFIASQVAIGIGNLDVFMIQDPTAYGYRMSADIREGIVPVRKNYNGTALVTYGQPPLA